MSLQKYRFILKLQKLLNKYVSMRSTKTSNNERQLATGGWAKLHSFANLGMWAACEICKCVQCGLGS